MIKFEEKVLNFITEYGLLEKGDKLLLGVSGGADSVCLLKVIMALRDRLLLDKEIVVLHVNHMIRGEEADEDEEFVKKLCASYGVYYRSYSKDIPAMAKELGISCEEAGRNYRYKVMNELAIEKKCTKIAVAHHANDLAETVLLNIIRGTGLSGLTGIEAKRGNIVRPLLCVKREDVEEYLKSSNQEFRTDSTNEQLDYTRNKIRHIILPAMEEINAGALDHIVSLARDAKNTDDYIAGIAGDFFDDKVMATSSICVDNCGNDTVCRKVVCNVDELCKYESIIQNKMIHNMIGEACGKKKDITRRHIEAVVELLYGETGKKVILPYNLVARRNYGELIIENGQEISGNLSFTEKVSYEKEELKVLTSNKPISVYISSGVLILEVVKATDELKKELSSKKNLYTKYFDYGKINFNVCIRIPDEGDYIVINEKGDRKKLNRLFIDAKVDREHRDNWPIVADDSMVMWAVDLRYNEYYKVDEDTEYILKITYTRD